MPEDRSRPPTALDRALDTALAELTTAAPPRGLRERVLARVAAAGPRPRPSAGPVRWTIALPVAAAVAAMALGGVWLTRNTGTPVPRETPSAVEAGSAAPLLPAPSAQPPASPLAPVAPLLTRAARQVRPASAPRRPTAPAARVPAAEDETFGLLPLESPAWLRAADLATVETREPPPLEVPSLRLEPLADLEDGGLGLP